MAKTPLDTWIETWGTNLDWEAKAKLQEAIDEMAQAELRRRAMCRPNLEFEKAIRPITPKGMRKSVRDAFRALDQALLLAIGSDWTSLEDANQYYSLASALNELEDEYNERIRS